MKLNTHRKFNQQLYLKFLFLRGYITQEQYLK